MIALGGGPCGGKSEMKDRIARALYDHKVHVIFMSETATYLIMNGLTPKKHRLFFQQMLAKLQVTREDEHLESARKEQSDQPWKRVVVLVDRGIPDGAGYLQGDSVAEAFDRDILVGDNVLGLKMSRDQVFARYFANIHLVTAADGAPAAYRKYRKSNPARTETIEQAIYFDRRILEAWKGHPDLRVVKNVDGQNNPIDFETKAQITIGHVFDILGVQPAEKKIVSQA